MSESPTQLYFAAFLTDHVIDYMADWAAEANQSSELLPSNHSSRPLTMRIDNRLLFLLNISFADRSDVWSAYFKLQISQALATGHILTTFKHDAFCILDSDVLSRPKRSRAECVNSPDLSAISHRSQN